MKFQILVLVLFLCGLVSYSSAEQALNLAYQDSDNFPYQMGDGDKINSDQPGIAVEQILSMGKRLNLDITLIRVPWKRGLRMLEQGKIDGLFNSSFKEERQKYGRYPLLNNKPDKRRRSYSNSYSLFIHKDNDIHWDGNIFSHTNFTVFVPLGFSVAGDLTNQGVTVTETSRLFKNLKLLNMRRIDAVALLSSSGDAYIRKYPKDMANVVKLEPPLVHKDYYLILSHQFFEAQSKLSERIWDTMGELRESKEYSSWFSKYLRDSNGK